MTIYLNVYYVKRIATLKKTSNHSRENKFHNLVQKSFIHLSVLKS